MFLSKSGILASFIYVGLFNLQNFCAASDHLPSISNKSSGISQTADQFKLFNPTCDFKTIVVTADQGLNPPDVAEKMDHNLFVIVENGTIPDKKNQQIINLPPEKVLGVQLNHDHRGGDLFDIIVRYKNLEALDLENYHIPMGRYAGNRIELSIRFLFNFQNLQILNLNRSFVFKANSVIAEILNDLQPAKNTLLSLNLSNAGVKSDPTQIKPYIPVLIQFDQIIDLQMVNNYLNPIDMEQICTNLINLERLNLSDNETIGPLGCMHITKLMNLTALNISNCDITVSEVEILKNLWKLRELDVSDNTEIGLESPVYLVKIKNLTSLNVSNCNIRTDGIEILAKLKFLRELNVSHNKLDDKKDNQPDLFHFLNKYEELRILNVSHNNINDISKFRHKNITDLDLSYNKLKNVDAIIKRESGLINLRKLNLCNNKITGFSIFSITTLEDLDLSYNKLNNPFSLSSLEQLLNLRKLNLQGNTFSLYKNVREDMSGALLTLRNIKEYISGALLTLRNITSGNNGELII